MVVSQADVRLMDFRKHFRPLLTRPCWGVHWEPQLNISMNFGQPRLRIREPRRSGSASPNVRRLASRRLITVRGQWWLWCFCSRWTLRVESLPPVRSSGSQRRIREALQQLDGQKLVQVDVASDTGRTRFAFDLGAVLETRDLDDDLSDIWSLYKPDGRVLSVRGDGSCSFGPGDEIATYRRMHSAKTAG